MPFLIIATIETDDICFGQLYTMLSYKCPMMLICRGLLRHRSQNLWLVSITAPSNVKSKICDFAGGLKYWSDLDTRVNMIRVSPLITYRDVHRLQLWRCYNGRKKRFFCLVWLMQQWIRVFDELPNLARYYSCLRRIVYFGAILCSLGEILCRLHGK